MLFQVKQTYDEDDIDIVLKAEKKKYRTNKLATGWFRLSALVGMFGLIFLSGWSLWQVLLAAFQADLSALLVAYPAVIVLTILLMVLFFPACVLLFNFAFPKEGAQKPSEEKELVFSFEEDYFILNDGQNESKISYCSLDKFMEKEDHFLLYLTDGCFPLRKSCFVVGTPEEFGPFMREKYRTKDMDITEKGSDER